jgi:hypothetical protein
MLRQSSFSDLSRHLLPKMMSELRRHLTPYEFEKIAVLGEFSMGSFHRESWAETLAAVPDNRRDFIAQHLQDWYKVGFESHFLSTTKL